MRESFVFHSEFIDDLPEEYRLKFMTFAVNYGIYGIEPETEGLEEALWKKIKRRIDTDIETYEQKKNARSAAGKKHKGNQYSRQKELENRDKESELSLFPEDEGGNGEEDETKKTSREEERTLSVSEPQSKMAKQIHEVFERNNLPCSPFIGFLSGEFKRGISYIHRKLAEYRLTSEDIVKACENYASVVNDKNDFYDIRLSFDRFVESQKFLDFLPSAFVKENWRKWEVKNKEAETEKTEEEGFVKWADVCPDCRKRELHWNNKLGLYKCFSCQKTFDYQTVEERRNE